jgi:hypothetical protein
MKSLTFYHQKRKDGGVRTGVELDGERVLEQFKPGRGAPDSALEWFVDVRCRGRHIPNDPEAVRRWLLDRGAGIQAHLEQMAADLQAGMDADWPLTSELPGTSNAVTIKIVCSAVRRLTGRDIGQVLLQLKRSWGRLIASLPAVPAEMAA